MSGRAKATKRELEEDGLDPELENIIDAFLTSRGAAGATETEIVALLEHFNKARLLVSCFRLVGEGRGFLVNLTSDGQPTFCYPRKPEETAPCESSPASSSPPSTPPPSSSS